jgi:hypothetical protein
MRRLLKGLLGTSTCLVSSLAMANSAVQLEEPFAVECTGISTSTGNTSGRDREVKHDLGKQVYVLDQQKQTVSRALEPRQEFDPVCNIKGDMAFVSFSPGLISADSNSPFESDPYSTCKFELNRMTGKGSQTLRMEWKGGRFHELKWEFDCAKTAIPVFDLSKRKF